MDERQEALRDILAVIRENFEELTYDIAVEQSEVLDDLGYPYDDQIYPSLSFPEGWSEVELPDGWGDIEAPDAMGHTHIPENWGDLNSTLTGSCTGGTYLPGWRTTGGYRWPTLAEALLWKMGKWRSYVKFVQDFADTPDAPLAGNRIVYQAFARHLRTTDLPIFDQHALRAVWALRGVPMDENWMACKNYLMTNDGNWNSSRPDDVAVASYTWYCDQIAAIPIIDNPIGLQAVDRLLMPLGKALKKKSANLAEFTDMTDW